MKKPLRWVPLWIDSWLYGSTRNELTNEERALWIDLLALAGKDQGFIRANENIPYPPEQLAGLLRQPVELLNKTIERCVETQKLTRLENGALYVTSWLTYKLTPQYRRKLVPGPVEEKEEERTKEEEIKKEESRGEESKGKGNTVSKKGNIVSKKRNNPPPNNNLPDIPKNLPFDVKDKLIIQRKEIRKLERVLNDEKEIKYQTKHGNYNSVNDCRKAYKEELERLKKEFSQEVNDYRD